jgi:lysophospholipase L1-like esterase
MAFGKLGAMGRGMGHLGDLGGAQPWSAALNLLKQQIIAQEAVNTPHQASAMASPPTVTDLGTSAPAAYPNNNLYSTTSLWRPEGGNVQVFGTQGWQFPVATVTTTGSGGNVSNGKDAKMWRVAFDVNAAKFAVMISASSSCPYRFIVDGAYVSKTATQTTLTTGGTNWIELDFTSVGGKANRHIVVEGMASARFRGVSLANGDSMSFPSALLSAGPNLLKAIYAGDSFTAGTGATFQPDGYVFPLGELLGVENNFGSGVGGTGFVATNSGSSYALPNRLGDINGQSADVIFSAMGFNDTPLTSWTAADIQTNATTCLQSFRTNNPRAPIFVIGPWDKNAPAAPVTNYAATKAAIQAAMAGISGCWFLDMEGVQFTKSGDATHPDTAGHWTLAQAVYAAIKTAIGVA